VPLPAEVASSIDVQQSALVLVDMNRRHLDIGGVGYITLPPARAAQVLERGAAALEAARAANMPVVHIATWSDPRTPWGPRDGHNPFFKWQTGKTITGAGFPRHSPPGLDSRVAGEPMPQVKPLHHEPVVVKKRYSGFSMTDVELIVRSFGVETLFMIGVNTNNCCLHTAFDAHARHFHVVLLEDACGSMNGQRSHDVAVLQIEAALGWIVSVEEFQAFAGRSRLGTAA
jgi:nicotinamidase-related amidase